jgi:redox-sensing transcriptional repressor
MVEIPDIVIGRLPIYLRALNQLARQGQEITSSRELGQHLGISSAQIRKDLSHFGGFGKQGTGYHVETLRHKLEEILKIDMEWPVVVVGAGHIGHALAHYRGFVNRGFRVVGVFDNNPDKIGEAIDGLTIEPMNTLDSFIIKHHIRLAMLAVPAEHAQKVAEQLIQAGVRGILNYAPITLNVPDGVYVQYIDPVAELQHMTFYLRNEPQSSAP